MTVFGAGFSAPTLRAEQCCKTKGPVRLLFRLRQVYMVERGSYGRGSHLMQCSSDLAFRGTMAIVGKVRTEELDGGVV